MPSIETLKVRTTTSTFDVRFERHLNPNRSREFLPMTAFAENPALDGGVIPLLPGDTLELTGTGDAPLTEVYFRGDSVPSSRGVFTLQVNDVGSHELELTFGTNQRATVKVVRLDDGWLERLRIPRATTKSAWRARAYAVSRAVLRERIGHDGLFPQEANWAQYTAGTGPTHNELTKEN